MSAATAACHGAPLAEAPEPLVAAASRDSSSRQEDRRNPTIQSRRASRRRGRSELRSRRSGLYKRRSQRRARAARSLDRVQQRCAGVMPIASAVLQMSGASAPPFAPSQVAASRLNSRRSSPRGHRRASSTGLRGRASANTKPEGRVRAGQLLGGRGGDARVHQVAIAPSEARLTDLCACVRVGTLVALTRCKHSRRIPCSRNPIGMKAPRYGCWIGGSRRSVAENTDVPQEPGLQNRTDFARMAEFGWFWHATAAAPNDRTVVWVMDATYLPHHIDYCP